MLEVPVYMITGFLESGKTTFIQEVLASPDFADGEKTLLLLCEEGEVEYDEKEYSRHNIEIMTVENEEDLTRNFWNAARNITSPIECSWSLTACGMRKNLLRADCPDTGRSFR